MQKTSWLLLLIVTSSFLDMVAGYQEEHWCSRCKLREQQEFNADPLLCDEILPGLLSITTTTESLSDKYGGMHRFAPGWTRKINLRSSSVTKDKKRKKYIDQHEGYEGDDDEPTSPIKPRKKKRKLAQNQNNFDDPPGTSWDEYFGTIKVEEDDLKLVPVVTACGDVTPSTCLPLSSPDQFGWSSEEEGATE